MEILGTTPTPTPTPTSRRATRRRGSRRSKSQKARLIKKLDKKDRTIRDLEAATGDREALDSLRRENSYLRVAISSGNHTIDLDAAFTLLTMKGFMDAVEVADSGEVSGMDDAFRRVLDRYPWLVDHDLPDDEPESPSSASGRRTKQRKPGGYAPDSAGLVSRFPALRARRRVL